MLKRIGASTAALVIFVGAAVAQQQVATTGSKGVILVNRGAGFKRVGPKTPLAPGDRVMVPPGGSATITYSDGCSVKVRPGATVTIGGASPCRAAETPQGDPGATPGTAGGVSVGTVAAGAAGAGLIATIVILATRNGNNGGGGGGGVGGGGGGGTPPISP